MTKLDVIKEAKAVIKMVICNLEFALGMNEAFPVNIKLTDAAVELDKLAEGER